MTSKAQTSLLVIGLFAICLTLSGCSGEFSIAPVKGTVMLDGKPLANATVYYQPQRQGESPIVGPPSIGVTDDSGHYAVTLTEGGSGAIVGPHIVSVSTYESRLVDPKNSDRIEVVSEEIVPKRYRSPSELKVTVPSGGVDDANFELMSK